MKNVLKLLVGSALLLSIATASFAQAAGPKTGPPPVGGADVTKKEQGGKKNPLMAVRELLQKFELNADQKAKIKTLQEEMMKTMKQTREDIKANKVEKKAGQEANMKSMKDFIQGLRGILSTDQMKQVEDALPAPKKKKK